MTERRDRPHRRRGRCGPRGRLLATGLLALLLPGCGPSPDDPLPSTDDLYVYSLAVAEKARLKVPELETLALYNVGQVHERFGFEEMAIEAYEKAIDDDRNFGAAYRRIGFLLSQRGNQMTEAIDAYQQALRCDPRAAGIYTRLGLIFLHRDRPEEAVTALAQEVSQETANAETYYHLGQAYSKQGQTARSVQAFRDALHRDPLMRSAHYALATELRVAGDAAGAEAALKKFRELKATEDAAAAAKQSQDGRAVARRAAAETWLDAGDLYHRGAYGPGAGSPPEDDASARSSATELARDSMAALEEAVRIDETFEEAWESYLKILQLQKQLEPALSVAGRAARAIPDDGRWPYRCALLHLQLARTGSEPRERYLKAVDLLEDATRKSPGLADAHFQLVRTILFDLEPRTGELLRRAVEHGEKAIELDPAWTHYDVLAYAYRLTNRVDLARRCLEEGIRRNPGAAPLKRRLDLLDKSLGGAR